MHSEMTKNVNNVNNRLAYIYVNYANITQPQRPKLHNLATQPGGWNK